jgi:urease accessory protein
MTWLSPAFPVGAFAYSSGIEWAVEAGDIHDARSLNDWIGVMLAQGAGASDAIFLAHAHRAASASDDAGVMEVAELAAALVPSRERYLETVTQGRAFLDAVMAAWPCAAITRLRAARDGDVTYPIAVGVTGAGHGVELGPLLRAYLHALAANWISVGLRTIPLGQSDSLRLLAGFESVIAQTARRAESAPLDAIGSSAFRADLASMHHEAQYTRLFRS